MKRVLLLLLIACLLLWMPFSAMADLTSDAAFDENLKVDEEENTLSDLIVLLGVNSMVGRNGGGISVIAVVVAALGVYVIWRVITGRKRAIQEREKQQAAARMEAMRKHTLRYPDEYRILDPKFDPDVILHRIEENYPLLQRCRMARDLSPLRPWLTDTLYAQLERQIKVLIKQKRTNYLEQVSVESVALQGFFQTDTEDHLLARLQTGLVDYTLEDADGKLVSGSRTERKNLTLEWELVRPRGIVSEEDPAKRRACCPYCGAAVPLGENVSCPSCNAVVTIKQQDWALGFIRSVAQGS